MKKIATSMLCLLVLFASVVKAQDATEIVKKVDEKVRGKSSRADMAMKIIRPKWTREMSLKSWSKGTKLALVLVTAPARDKGTATLKRDKEIWTWQPSIDRVIKLPPSMMMQSWMGSDFTNDDLIKESSIVNDYDPKILSEETIGDRPCWKIHLTQKPNSAVVWGKVLMWVDKKDYIQMKTEFYDEDGTLVNTMLASDIKNLGGKMLASHLEMIPADKNGNKTVIEYHTLVFDEPYTDDFFSEQQMKKIR